jgi:hypothetical protein
MRYGIGLTAVGIAAVGSAGVALPAMAQQGTFPDVPANHWAYQAVTDLARRGYVQGYPDGRFHGQRAMTRYEFATVIRRMLNTIDDMNARINNRPPTTPSGAQVTQDDLNKLQSLVTSFQKELADLKTDVAREQSAIDQLRKDVLQAKQMAAQAQATANASYGFVPIDTPEDQQRPFQLGGYVQARYQSARSSDKTLFPPGVPANTGPLASYNGNYAVGGTANTFFVRRARLRASGRVTDHTRYAIMIDATGFTNNPNGNNNVVVKEANVSYTFGKGEISKNPSIMAGIFANFFGYVLPISTADMLTPERPLAFNDGASGLWINQDYDRGIDLNIPFGQGFTLRGGVVNGTGLSGNDNNDHVDPIVRLGYQTKNHVFGIGASYYDGRIPRTGTNAAGVPFTGPNYQEGKKQVGGFDARLNLPAGLFVGGEYVNGKYEQRSFFTSDTAFTANAFAPDNKVEGYYIQGGLTLFGRSAHPLVIATNYDVFKRSNSGVSAGTPGGASGSSFDDENWGYGALWRLDKQTRFRFWYTRPSKVAHAANVAEPTKVDMAMGEIQVRF